MTFTPHRQTNWLDWSMGCTSQFRCMPVLCSGIVSRPKALNAGNDVTTCSPLGLIALLELADCSLLRGENTEEPEVMCQCSI